MITDKFLFIVLEKLLWLPRKRLPFFSFIGGIPRLTFGNIRVPVGRNFTVTGIKLYQPRSALERVDNSM